MGSWSSFFQKGLELPCNVWRFGYGRSAGEGRPEGDDVPGGDGDFGGGGGERATLTWLLSKLLLCEVMPSFFWRFSIAISS